MYPLETNPTAIQVIQRSMTCHPSLFAEALQSRANEDSRYAASRPECKMTQSAAIASYSAAIRAIALVQDENAEGFTADLGAGIIALNIACKLQCLPPHIRTAAAVITWGDN